MELNLVKLLSKIDNHKRFSPLIKEERLSKDITFILSQLQPYYTACNKEAVDWDEFDTWLTLNHPNLSEEKIKTLRGYFFMLKGLEDEDGTVLKTLSTQYYATEISDVATDISYGDGEMSQITELLREYNLEVKGIEYDMDALNLSPTEMIEDLKNLKDTVKYSWSVRELELMLGSISQGDFLILGGRPDSGKTTILSTQAVNWAKQLKDDQCILWCNNEEDGRRVRLRQVQAGLNWTRDEILADINKAMELFDSKVGSHKIKMLNNPSMTVHDIEAAIELTDPKIIIIDQIWKVSGFEKTSRNRIDRYKKLAQYIRELALKHGAIIGASQLDGSADGEKYPKMGALYNSKTAVQGEADAIITIGQCPEEGADLRFLSAPKNKLAYADNEWRNAGVAVKLVKDRAQIRSLKNHQRESTDG